MSILFGYYIKYLKMNQTKRFCFLLLFSNLILLTVHSQNFTINGNVKNSQSKENASAISVTIKGAQNGTFTNDKGNFSIVVKSLPAKLIFSSIGFDEQEVEVTSSNSISVKLNPSTKLGQEVVVSASRVVEKILESPVSVERVTATNIRNAAGANYYDIVASLKGVDVTTSSLTFKTPTTRGFNGSGNTRFNQLVDGMDNQAPGLNFPVASLVGLSELDIDNMELLSGASSALYGSGGMNGTLLINSKNPFKYQGLSFVAKEGIMHLGDKERGASPYHNFTLRWAKKVNEKFAFKLNAEVIQAKDWVGDDYRNYARSATLGNLIPGTRQSDANYDGINIYGDETTVDIRSNILNPIGATAAPFLANFIDTLNHGKDIFVSRTGYTENQVVDPVTVNYKLSGSLHYKLSANTEAILAGYWGTGNTIYSGSERYSLINFKMGQYKLELQNKDWSLRAYTTQENSGNSYNMTVATRLFNESWKPSVYFDAQGNPHGWYIDYATTYLDRRLNGYNDANAHTAARAFADLGRPDYNTTQFKNSFDSIKSISIAEGGAKLVDHSSLYCLEGNLNLSKYTSNFADVLIGGSYKMYVLDSDGNLFGDDPNTMLSKNFLKGAITTSEKGFFIQATKSLFEKYKLSVSGRYDKNQNFKGRFTPRATLTYKLAEYNHLRLSYQTAYRFPSNQQQWIDLGVGTGVRLLGCNDYFNTKYNFNGNQLYDLESFMNNGTLVKFNKVEVKPEAISSFETGYKGLIMGGKMMIDIYGYFGQYQDFIGRKLTVQFKDGIRSSLADTNNRYYSLPVNSTDKVKTYGFGGSIDYRLPKNFTVGMNISSDRLVDVPEEFIAYFNMPLYKGNFSIGNTGFGPSKRLGFNVNYRWQQKLYYEADFANANLPAVHTLDAQVSFKLPKTKSIIKMGANNLLNQYYYNAPGNPHIGGLYYLSFGYNVY